MFRQASTWLLLVALCVGVLPPALPAQGATRSNSPGSAAAAPPALPQGALPQPNQVGSVYYDTAAVLPGLRAQYAGLQGSRHISPTLFRSEFRSPRVPSDDPEGPGDLKDIEAWKKKETLFTAPGGTTGMYIEGITVRNSRLADASLHASLDVIIIDPNNPDPLSNESRASLNPYLTTTSALTRTGEGVYLSLAPLTPHDHPFEVYLRCYAGSGPGSCSWKNLTFWNDRPQGDWQLNHAMTGYGPWPQIRMAHQASVRGLFSVAQEQDRDALVVETFATSRTPNPFTLQSPVVTIPDLPATQERIPVQLTADWMRRSTGGDGSVQGVRLSFLPVGAPFDQAVPLHFGGISEGWAHEGDDTRWKHDVSEWLPARYAGARGVFLLSFSYLMFGTYALAIDNLTLQANGQAIPFGAASQWALCPDCLASQVQAMEPLLAPLRVWANTLQRTVQHQSPVGLEVPSRSGLLVHSTTYASGSLQAAGAPSELGPGWRHRFDARLTLAAANPLAGTVFFEAPDGVRLRFEGDGAGRFSPAPEVTAELTYRANIYVLTQRNGTKWLFNTAGLLTELRTDKGAAVQIQRNADGQIQTVTDPVSQRSLTYSYTTVAGQSRLRSVSDGSGTVTYGYDSAGRLQQISDPVGATTTYGYQSGSGLLSTISDAAGVRQLTLSYDSADKLDSVLDATGIQTRLAQRLDPATGGTVATLTRRAGGQTVLVSEHGYRQDQTLEYTAQNSRLTSFRTFDGNGGLTTLVDGSLQPLRRDNTENGLPLRVTDAAGALWHYAYGPSQRLSSETGPDLVQRRYSYDIRGNLIRTQSQSGTLQLTTVYTYTALDQLRELRTTDGVSTTLAYDARGQLIAQTAASNSSVPRTTSFAYDAAGRLTRTTVGAGSPFERTDVTTYRADGSVATTTGAFQDGAPQPGTDPQHDRRTRYGYDSSGRAVWTQDAAGRYTYTHYNQAGQVDWSARNFVRAAWNESALPATEPPPAFSASAPDQNVVTLYGYDSLGRTVLVTETGLLDNQAQRNPATGQASFASALTRVTRSEYDELGRPFRVTANYRPDAPAGPDVNVQTLAFYDGAGNLIWQRDGLGRWTKFEHQHGRLVRTIANYEDGDPSGVLDANRSWTDGHDTDLISVTVYDQAGRVERSVANWITGRFSPADPSADRITRYQYDALGRVVATTAQYDDGDPQTGGADTDVLTQSQYDPATGRLQGTRDPLGRWTGYRYDGAGRPWQTVQNCVSAAGLPNATACAQWSRATPDRNLRTVQTYDVLWRPRVSIDNYIDGQPGALADEDINTLTDYTLHDEVAATTANYVGATAADTSTQNIASRTSYDILGRAVTQTDPTGRQTTLSYNGLGQIQQIVNPAGHTTRYGYDGRGARRWTLGPDQQLTVVYLDPLGRPQATVANFQDGLPGPGADTDLITRQWYDAAGRLIQSADAANRVTAYSYDLLDQLVQVREYGPLSACQPFPGTCLVGSASPLSWMSYSYDRAGNQIRRTNARNATWETRYDASGRPVERRDPLGRVTSWTYDRAGRVATQLDPRGNRPAGTPRDTSNDLSYTYDGLDRLIEQRATNLAGGRVGYSYDALGRRTSLLDGSSATPSIYQFDALGRMRKVTPGQGGAAVEYDYSARGDRTAVRFSNGRAPLTYTYTPDRQIDTVVQNGVTLANYDYDTAGRLERASYGIGAVTTYAYDGASRLRRSTTQSRGQVVADFDAELDVLGLPRSVAEQTGTAHRTVTYDYDGLRRLRSAVESPGASYSYEYDAAGNRTKTTLNGQTATTAYDLADQVAGYTYDDAGNLTGDGQRSYTYDALSRVTKISQGGADTLQTYNGDGLLLAQTRAGTTTRYQWDEGRALPQLLSTTAGASTPLYYDYGVGRLRVEEDSTRLWDIGDLLGSVRVRLSPSGLVTSSHSYDPWGQPEGAAPPLFGFAGELQQGALLYLRARWYNAASGTFTSVDQFAGFPEQPYSLHPYQYAYAQPNLLTDPSGMCILPNGQPCPKVIPGQGPAATPRPPKPTSTPTPTSSSAPKGFYTGDGNYCVAGFFKQVSLNATWGQNSAAEELPGEPLAMTACRRVGDLATIGLGGLEMFGGGGAAAAGVVACAGAITCMVGGPAAAAGAGVALHGGGMVVQGTWRFVSGIVNACMSSGGGGGGGGPSRTPVPPAPAPTAGVARGRAPEFPGGAISEAQFPDLAQQYLGAGYAEVSPGRYVSADGMRQVRYGEHETRGVRHHAHFEAYDRPYHRGGRVIENTVIDIIP